MTDTKMYSFASAMREFFGLRPGTNLQDFMAELKALDGDDRAYFKQHLTAAGYNIQ